MNPGIPKARKGNGVFDLVVLPVGRRLKAANCAKYSRMILSLGLGLDEKAIEAVNKWKFRPGYKGGQPVAVQATIEVNPSFCSQLFCFLRG